MFERWKPSICCGIYANKAIGSMLEIIRATRVVRRDYYHNATTLHFVDYRYKVGIACNKNRNGK